MLLFLTNSGTCILKLARNLALDSLRRVLPDFSKASVGIKKKSISKISKLLPHLSKYMTTFIMLS